MDRWTLGHDSKAESLTVGIIVRLHRISVTVDGRTVPGLVLAQEFLRSCLEALALTQQKDSFLKYGFQILCTCILAAVNGLWQE